MKIFTVCGTTESGDDWRLVFRNRPDESQILREIYSDPWLNEEYESGCLQGWHIDEVEIIDN